VLWWAVFQGMAMAQAAPLHGQVDLAMEQARLGPAPAVADDLSFLRRSALALTGMPPGMAETRAFMADPAPDKRPRLIANLTSRPEFIHHLAVQLDVLLMERRAELHTKSEGWRHWLEDSLTEGKTWDQLVREILATDGVDPKTRPIARWLLERQAEPNLLARDAGRLFLGRDLACAQCHDHPRIDDYSQRDYHGLAAFFGRTYLFQADEKAPGYAGEQATGEASWTSVFTKVKGSSGPRLAGGVEITEPAIAPSDFWKLTVDDPKKPLLAVPTYSRRGRLADVMAADPAFRRNIANRVWGMVMGRCLVEPPDLLHSANPPVHPAVLDLIANGLAEMKFDLRPFVRELALTRTFAEAFEPAPPDPPGCQGIAASLPQLESAALETKQESVRLGLVFTEAVEAHEAVCLAVQPAIEPWEVAKKAFDTALQAAAKAVTERQKAEELNCSLTASGRLFREAAVAGAQAAAAAPDDKGLAAAAKAFLEKADKTAGEAAAAIKDLPAKEAAVASTAAAVEPARLAAAAKKPAADEALGKIAAAQAIVDKADREKQQARVTASQAARKVSEAKAILAYAGATEALPSKQEEATKRRSALGTLTQSLASQRTALTTLTASLTALEAAAAKEAAPTQAQTQSATLTLAGTAAGQPERAAESRRQSATLVENLKAVLAKAQAKLTADESSLPAMQAAAAEADQQAASAQQALAEAGDQLSQVRSTSFSIANLNPIPPEQLCWSILQVTGALEQLQDSAKAEWDAKNPPVPNEPPSDAKATARQKGIDALTQAKISPHEKQFIQLFANGAGQPQSDFFATADQVLYFENAGSLRHWTRPAGQNLAARLEKITDPQAFAEELFLAILTRLPDAGEIQDIRTLLASHPAAQRADAISDTIWALVTSTEFRFRH